MRGATAWQETDRQRRIVAVVPATLTIAEAARQTGLSPAAIARRIERGSLAAVLRDGRRRIPASELERAGLLASPTDRDELAELRAELVAARALTQRAESAHAAEFAAHEHTRLAFAEQAAAARAAQLRSEQIAAQLAEIANAGPIRAMRLRRQARRELATAPCDDIAARETSATLQTGDSVAG